MKVKATVTVYPRPEVLDPQGVAIRKSLERVGFDSVTSVRAGRSFDLELATDDAAAARGQLEEMCERLLANTVVEDYAIELHEEAAAVEGNGGGGG